MDIDKDKLKIITSWIIVLVLILFGIFSLASLYVRTRNSVFWVTLLKEQFPVVVGLPIDGLFSLFVTIVLKFASGPIEFEIVGMKFKGGAGPIVFWIMCFLSISVAIRFLWQS